jgi:hypothetical protein
MSSRFQGLDNKGGITTLLNNKGLKVDGVSYTSQQAQNEGCNYCVLKLKGKLLW